MILIGTTRRDVRESGEAFGRDGRKSWRKYWPGCMSGVTGSGACDFVVVLIRLVGWLDCVNSNGVRGALLYAP